MSNYNKNRRIKYHFVLNLTGDVELAKRARGWSLKTIEHTFGVSTSRRYYGKQYTILEKPPKREKLTKRQIVIRKNRFKKRGITIPQPGQQLIDPTIPYIPRTKVPISIPDVPTFSFPNLKKFEHSNLTKIENWAFWAETSSYPSVVHDFVSKVNKAANKRVDDSYGWAITYYMYVNDINYDDIIKFIKPHKFIDDFYEDNLKHLNV